MRGDFPPRTSELILDWIGPFAVRGDLGDAMQDFQRGALGRPEAQAAGDGVDVSVHSSPPATDWRG